MRGSKGRVRGVGTPRDVSHVEGTGPMTSPRIERDRTRRDGPLRRAQTKLSKGEIESQGERETARAPRPV